ncbi:hypothetical protein [uncultured Erythrobacter sp.]|uniref:hypothetical protein n=1 Tax=uncultured Erythrobacter sp. TaxID=263913 RepID=UPI00261932AC|nr:hypothetical protein [uncultured Erythrobacter sp.]
MSSNAAAPVQKISVWAALLAGLSLSVSAPAAAQDGAQDDAPEAEAVPAPRPPRDIINLSVTVPREESDQLLEQDCEVEADAARIANEIVVCRQLGEASDGSWNKEDFERRYAERTQGEQPVDTFGIANHGNAIGFGSVPPPALMIDVEALPQAPEGSDADRIARGLPPLGQDPEPTPEEIAERRRAAGLEAPPIPTSNE